MEAFLCGGFSCLLEEICILHNMQEGNAHGFSCLLEEICILPNSKIFEKASFNVYFVFSQRLQNFFFNHFFQINVFWIVNPTCANILKIPIFQI